MATLYILGKAISAAISTRPDSVRHGGQKVRCVGFSAGKEGIAINNIVPLVSEKAPHKVAERPFHFPDAKAPEPTKVKAP
jgi:hypothetical protein